jgi:hypothetical protein
MHRQDRGHRSCRCNRRLAPVRAFAASVESWVQSARVTGRIPSAGRAEPT